MADHAPGSRGHMILAIVVASGSNTVVLATSAGAIVATRDASWRVGSGRSLATHVAQLLGDPAVKQAVRSFSLTSEVTWTQKPPRFSRSCVSPVEITNLTRLVLIDQGGSYTSARTAYAFVQALAFTCALPVVLRQSGPDRPLADELAGAASAPPSVGPIVPRYEES